MKFLVGKGADVNRRDAQGQAAVHSAARQRKPEMLAAVLDLGADIDARDQDGLTALVYAVMRDHAPSVTLLAERGADLEAMANGGFTPLGLAIVEDRYRAAMALIAAGAPSEVGKLTPLMLAAGKEGHRLSLGAGKDRIEKLDPRDPGTLEIARALIGKGAGVNAVASSGVTALILAAAAACVRP